MVKSRSRNTAVQYSKTTETGERRETPGTVPKIQTKYNDVSTFLEQKQKKLEHFKKTLLAKKTTSTTISSRTQYPKPAEPLRSARPTTNISTLKTPTKLQQAQSKERYQSNEVKKNYSSKISTVAKDPVSRN